MVSAVTRAEVIYYLYGICCNIRYAMASSDVMAIKIMWQIHGLAAGGVFMNGLANS